jgi:hypothetical protein
MPHKPIKQGFKVFAICCAASAVLLGYEASTGKDESASAAAIAIMERLILDAGLTTSYRRTIFTDNWYTSVKLANMLFEKFGWYFCGTVVSTPKVSRKDQDIPFHKLSKGAMKAIP